MAGTIVVDRLESDASYASSINIASPVIVSNTFAFPAGSNTAPAISPVGDRNTGIFFPDADTIAFTEGGVESMRIDSAGYVGIGTTSPSQKITVDGNINLTTGANRFIRLGSSSNYSYDVMSSGDDFQIRESADDSKIRLRIKYNGTPSVSGQLQLPIDGSSTLYNSYTCRAWVNFNGTGTVAIRGSGNVSSITDDGVGQYKVNFTTAMPDVNYSSQITLNGGNAYIGTIGGQTTSAVTVYGWTDASAFFDASIVSVQVVR
jgi:hypothetical protein